MLFPISIYVILQRTPRLALICTSHPSFFHNNTSISAGEKRLRADGNDTTHGQQAHHGDDDGQSRCRRRLQGRCQAGSASTQATSMSRGSQCHTRTTVTMMTTTRQDPKYAAFYQYHPRLSRRRRQRERWPSPSVHTTPNRQRQHSVSTPISRPSAPSPCQRFSHSCGLLP